MELIVGTNEYRELIALGATHDEAIEQILIFNS